MIEPSRITYRAVFCCSLRDGALSVWWDNEDVVLLVAIDGLRLGTSLTHARLRDASLALELTPATCT